MAEAGYQIGLTNLGGVNRIWPTAVRVWPIDRFDLCRLRTERSQSDAMFLAQIAIPQLASMHGLLPRSPARKAPRLEPIDARGLEK